MGELLCEIAAQALELFRLAQILGADHLVDPPSVGLIVRAARLVALITRPPRFCGGLRIAHLGVIGHLGGRRVDCFRARIGKFVGGGFRLHAHALGIGRIRRIAVLALLVLAILLVAFVALLLVGLA